MKLNELRGELERCQRMLFVTGAGISTESGLPTYRGIGGLYHDTKTEEGVRIEDALSGPMFLVNPELSWKYLWQIAEACRGKKPNRAHEILAALEDEREEVWVLTQNVDGLHRAAGSTNLIEIHGRAQDLVCTKCDNFFDGEDLLFGGVLSPPEVPECPSCGGILRPDVVLFGEMLPEEGLNQLAALEEIPFEAVFSIGTSSLFAYIQAPIYAARHYGIMTVEVNQEETEVSRVCDHQLRMTAVEALEALFGQR